MTGVENVITPEKGEAGPRKLRCIACQKQFTHKDTLRKHARKHNKNSVCGTCGRSFRAKGELRKHVEQVHYKRVKMILCSEEGCEVKFRSNYDLNLHLACDHSKGDSKIACTSCGMSFKHKNALISHQIKIHSAPKLACTSCRKTFSAKQSLQRHAKRCGKLEDEEKTVCCTYPECPMKFALDRYMKSHVRTVHVKNSFQCYVCDVSFNSRASRLRHVRKNHPDREQEITE